MHAYIIILYNIALLPKENAVHIDGFVSVGARAYKALTERNKKVAGYYFRAADSNVHKTTTV